MRFLTLLISIFLFNNSFSQVYKYWIYDTVHVECFYATYAIIPDTLANFKKDTITKGKVAIYWDKEFKHLYTERDLGNPTLPAITWYRNGQMDEKILNHIKEGSKGNDWSFFGWYPDGNKKSETQYKGKTRKMIYYHQNGKLKRLQVATQEIQNGDPNYFQFIYEEERCENGQLVHKDSVNSTTIRKFTRYHCNGKKEREFIWDGYNIVGKFNEWYENGQLKTEGMYDDHLVPSKVFTDQTKEQGVWKYYDETGKLTKEEIYKDGVVIETKNY